MITPSQLREHEFKPAGRNAYKAEDVDAFFAELRADYEKMFRENGELSKRANMLAETLEKYKKSDGDIKKAVIAAQRASEVIMQEAETEAQTVRAEADAILAAAKSEAQIIRDDADKQVAADSERLLSVTKERVQQIIIKAKKEADEIVAQARVNAGDQIGVATRTVTSETILYDMLKKEVADFRASILAQYKSHIELIQKLPEVAVDEAIKSANGDEVTVAAEEPDYTDEAAIKADEIFDSIIPAEDENSGNDSDFDEAVISIGGDDREDDAISFLTDSLDISDNEYIDENDISEDVVRTELPFGFFDSDSEIEYVDDVVDFADNVDIPADIDETNADELIMPESDSEVFDESFSDESVSDTASFTVDVDSFDFESFNADSATSDDSVEAASSDDDFSHEPKDIPISRPVSFNKEDVSVISDIQTASASETAEHRKKAFFKRKKNNNNN